MTNWVVVGLVSFFGALLSAMGMGGGGILLLYLTVVLGLGQLEAQGINLVFFLPIAAVALVVHIRKGLVEWRATLGFVLAGLAGVPAGFWLAEVLGSALLGKLFGGFLLAFGVKELLATFNTNHRLNGKK